MTGLSRIAAALALAFMLAASPAFAALPCSADPNCGGIDDQGTVNQGTVDQGQVNQGVADQGAVDQGTVGQGVANQGAVDQGTPDRSIVDQGKRQFLIDTGQQPAH